MVSGYWLVVSGYWLVVGVGGWSFEPARVRWRLDTHMAPPARIALCIVATMLFAAGLTAQRTFEVAAVKENTQPERPSGLRRSPDGSVRAERMRARFLITIAYGLQPFQLLNAPGGRTTPTTTSTPSRLQVPEHRASRCQTCSRPCSSNGHAGVPSRGPGRRRLRAGTRSTRHDWTRSEGFNP